MFRINDRDSWTCCMLAYLQVAEVVRVFFAGSLESAY